MSSNSRFRSLREHYVDAVIADFVGGKAQVLITMSVRLYL